MNILGKQSDMPFSRKSDCKKEKSTVSFTHEQNIICSQTLLTALRMSRPLFVGSYLQVTWWAFGQWKERKFASNDNNYYLHLSHGQFFETLEHDINSLPGKVKLTLSHEINISGQSRTWSWTPKVAIQCAGLGQSALLTVGKQHGGVLSASDLQSDIPRFESCFGAGFVLGCLTLLPAIWGG